MSRVSATVIKNERRANLPFTHEVFRTLLEELFGTLL
jgi:hypothetical protein